MSDNYDYVPSYDEDGNFRHYGTAEPKFESTEVDNQYNNDAVSTVRIHDDSGTFRANGPPGEVATGTDVLDCLSNAVASEGLNYTLYRIQPGDYVASTQVDLTGYKSVFSSYIDLRGVRITVEGGGNVAFDMTDTHRGPNFMGGLISGSSGMPPAVCFLDARNDQGGSAGLRMYHNVRVDGEWTVAPWYNYASESNSYEYISARNDHGDAEGAFILSSDNHLGVTSDFDTVGTQDRVNTDHSFHAAHMLCTGSSSGAGLLIRGGNSCADLDFSGNTFIDAKGRSALEFDLRNGGTVNRINFDSLRVELPDPDYGVFVRGPPSGQASVLQWTIENCRVQGSVKDFKAEQNTQIANCSLGNLRLNSTATMDVDVWDGDVNIRTGGGSITINGTWRSGEIKTRDESDVNVPGSKSAGVMRNARGRVSEVWDGAAWVDIV